MLYMDLGVVTNVTCLDTSLSVFTHSLHSDSKIEHHALAFPNG